ncbi:MAG: LD-carboxypeptidase [Myxococcota bacterium]|nr:LD-carboxypeptidase [Myxococcota bacterium]
MTTFPIHTVCVVAPSGQFSSTRLAQSTDLLHKWGFKTIETPHLHSGHLFMAGKDTERRSDLVWAANHPEVDFIWFARGGYGTVHTLSAMDWSEVKQPILGYSDATALLIHLYQSGGTAIHGPVLHALSDHDTDQSRQAVQNYLNSGTLPPISGDWLWGPKAPVKGPVTGGNLCVLSTLCGTKFSMRANGHIVLLEEIAEPAYKIHRMLSQLRFSGAFDGALGIAFGELTHCQVPSDAPWTMHDVIIDALKPLGIPIYTNLPFGHGGLNLLWQYGQPISLGH